MNIEVVSASAGTGKTRHLTKVLTEALLNESARPEGVVAVTYTKKAASELASRIRRALLTERRADLAERVRDGYLGTIHSVCQRLLGEFALEAGLSPMLEPLPEIERIRLFDEALARVLRGRQGELTELARRLSIDDWKEDLRTIVDRARENGMGQKEIGESVRRSRESLLAFLPVAPERAGDYRRATLDALEATLPTLDEEARDDNKAARARAAAARGLKADLERFPGVRWKDLLQVGRALDLKKLRPVTGPLVEIADHHHESSAFRDDLLRYQELTFGVASEALESFASQKAVSRVIDFGDMIAHLRELLDRPTVRAVLADRLDLVLVDEFQDTSPVQLAVVTGLARVAKRSVWVGDRKQAIFGFQGSDPELMSKAAEAVLDGREPEVLGKSHRSRPSLVDAVSEIFVPALGPAGFPEAQVRIEAANADPEALTDAPALATWRWQPERVERDGAKVSATEAHAVAAGVEALLSSPPLVRERVEGTDEFRVRKATRRDVAVLAFSNDRCRAIAAALRMRGIPALVSLEGLTSTPEAILAISALGLVADPQDGVAALEVAWLGGAAGDPDTWLSRRLAEITVWRDAQSTSGDENRLPRPLAFDDDPRVHGLREANATARNLSPAEALDLALRIGEIVEIVRSWPEPEQRLANLEVLRAEARDFESLCRARRSAATAIGLHSHLAGLRTEHGPGEKQAQPTAEDAVTVSTWHGAKGLEWPIVVLAHLDYKRDPRVFDVAVEPAEHFDFVSPLVGRWIRFWPWPYGAMATSLALLDAAQRTGEADRFRERTRSERLRVLYVGFTRAKDLLVLVAKTSPGHEAVLPALEPLQVPGEGPIIELPLGEPDGAAAWTILGCEHASTLATYSGLIPERGAQSQGARNWYAPGQRATDVREIVNPSTEAVSKTAKLVAVSPLAGRRTLEESGVDMRKLGDAIHAFLAADPGGEAPGRAGIARRLLESYEVLGQLTPETLLHVSDTLRRYLDGRYPGAQWFREWPIRARLSGTPERLLVGEVDLFLDLPQGFVLVDHKSFPGSAADRDRKIVEHWGPQLAWYARALEPALKKPLLAALVHLPIRGEIAELTLG